MAHVSLIKVDRQSPRYSQNGMKFEYSVGDESPKVPAKFDHNSQNSLEVVENPILTWALTGNRLGRHCVPDFHSEKRM